MSYSKLSCSTHSVNVIRSFLHYIRIIFHIIKRGKYTFRTNAAGRYEVHSADCNYRRRESAREKCHRHSYYTNMEA